LVVFDRYANGYKRTGAFYLTPTERIDTGNVDSTVAMAMDVRFVAMNRIGEGVLVWTRGSPSELAVSTYNPKTGWSPAKSLANGPFQDYFACAMSDDGTIAVAYAKKASSTYNLAVQSGKMTTGSFTATTYLESDNKSTSAFMSGPYGDDWEFSFPQLAVDTMGNKTGPDNMLMVFHKQESGTTSSLWGTRLENGTWRTPVLLARMNGMHALYASVDVAGSGFGAYAFLYMDAATPSSNANDMQVHAGFFNP
jgi:hypothetical protein